MTKPLLVGYMEDSLGVTSIRDKILKIQQTLHVNTYVK